MKYNWTEITEERNPKNSKPLLLNPVAGETDGTVFSNTLQIDP